MKNDWNWILLNLDFEDIKISHAIPNLDMRKGKKEKVPHFLIYFIN